MKLNFVISAQEPEVVETTATVGEQSTPDFRSTLPDALNTNGLTVVLALVAVLGGGAAWRFYEGVAKRRHELKMAEIKSKAEAENITSAVDARVKLMMAEVDKNFVSKDEFEDMVDEKLKKSKKRGRA